MSKEVRNDSNELAEHGSAVCQWASASILKRCCLSLLPAAHTLYAPRAHAHTCVNAHLNNLRSSPLLIWFHPSVSSSLSDFTSPAAERGGRTAPHVWLCVRACEHMHIDGFEKEMWCQISTWPRCQVCCLSSLPLLILLSTDTPLPHTHTLIFSSVKMVVFSDEAHWTNAT